MKIEVNWRLLDKARYNMKVRKLCRKMADCMDSESVMSCAESAAKVLRMLPDPLKEALIDKLIQTIDETRERLERGENV